MVDLEILIARDHAGLDKAVEVLAAPTTSVEERRHALGEARLCFAAHAEAEANVLHRALVHVPPTHAASRQLVRLLDEHRAQEGLLARLDRAHPASLEWVRILRILRSSFAAHAENQRIAVVPTLREAVLAPSSYERLASCYATERLRALGMMSAVVATPRRRRDETRT